MPKSILQEHEAIVLKFEVKTYYCGFAYRRVPAGEEVKRERYFLKRKCEQKSLYSHNHARPPKPSARRILNFVVFIQTQETQKMSSIASFLSSFIGTAHADAEEKAPADEEVVVEAAAEEEEPEDVRVVVVSVIT